MTLEFYMADTTELRGFARFEGIVGGGSALKLCALFGGSTLYVPNELPDGHVLVWLLGRRDADYLCQALSGQDVHVPGCEMKSLRLANKLRHQMQRGVAPSAAAAELGVSQRHARRLAAKLLHLEGYDPRLISYKEKA